MRNPSVYLSSYFMSVVWPRFAEQFKNSQSKSSYFSDICLFADYIKKDVLDATELDANKYIAYLMRENLAGRIKKGTIIKKHRELSSLFTFIIKNQDRFTELHGISNVFAGIPVIEQEEKIAYDDVLDVETIDKLIGCLKDTDTMTLLAVLFSFKMLMRTEEFIRLKVSDIVQDPNGHLGIGIKDGNSYRYNKVPDDMVELLSEYVSNLNLDCSDYLFGKKTNRSVCYTTKTLGNRLKAAFKEIGSRSYTFNNFRNSGIVFSVSNGADVSDVADAIGMSSTTHIGRLQSLSVHFNCACDYVNVNINRNGILAHN